MAFMEDVEKSLTEVDKREIFTPLNSGCDRADIESKEILPSVLSFHLGANQNCV